MDNSSEKELSASQVQAAILVAAGKTGRFVAQSVDVTEQTLSRWKGMTSFKQLVDRHRAENARSLASAVAGLLPSAVEVYRAALVDPSIAVRFRAAQSVFAMWSEVGDPPVTPSDPEATEKPKSKSPFDLQ